MADPVIRNLIQRAAAVMAVIEHVPKNGRNEFHKYDYATEADIVSAVRKEMAAQELMLIPSVEKIDWRTVKSARGDQQIATLTVRFTLTDGREKQEFVVLGEGQDSGDKATYKAMTGALKYALLKLFLIPTGDDPEADDDPPAKPAPKAPAKKPVSNLTSEMKAQVAAAVQSAAKPPPAVAVLWARAQKEYGEDAKENFAAATVRALGSAKKPSNAWTPEDVAAVEAQLFAPDDDIQH